MLRAIWVIVSGVVFIIGLSGIPGDIATWQKWITDMLREMNQDAARWIFAIVGLLGIGLGLFWPKIKSIPHSRWWKKSIYFFRKKEATTYIGVPASPLPPEHLMREVQVSIPVKDEQVLEILARGAGCVFTKSHFADKNEGVFVRISGYDYSLINCVHSLRNFGIEFAIGKSDVPLSELESEPASPELRKEFINFTADQVALLHKAFVKVKKQWKSAPIHQDQALGLLTAWADISESLERRIRSVR